MIWDGSPGRKDGIRTVENVWGAFLKLRGLRLEEIALYIHIKYQSKTNNII
jgi:hypothetical protein